MKICRRVWLGSVAVCVGLMTGCDPAGPALTVIEEPLGVVFLSAHGERVFEAGQRRLLARLMANAPRYHLQTLDAGFSVETQLAQLRAAVAEKPFAILLDPLEPEPLRETVAAAVSSGILVIGLGEGSADMGCSTVLSTDQRKLGQLAGELAVSALLAKAREAGKTEAEGRVIEIRGDDDSPVCQRRHEGFEAGLKTAPGVILVHDAPGGWSLTGGSDRTADALRLQQTFDVVYAHNDLMALGAAKALKERRAEVMIIGTDGFRGREGGMTLVGDGEIDATLYQPLLVDFAWVLMRKKAEEPAFQPKPGYEMTTRTILPKDVDEIRRKGLPAFPEL